MHKIWFSFFDRGIYKGPEPYFTPINEINGLDLIEKNHHSIKHEFDCFINSTNPFKEYFNKSTVTSNTRWKTFSLRYWNKNYIHNQKHFPVLTSLINKIPNCVSCSFSVLEANSQIKPHCGDTNAIWRCHHAIYVPANLPTAGFKVGTQERPWEEGKTFAFCDAHAHESWNNSNAARYVIIFDIIKPGFINNTNHICSVVLSSITLQKIAEKRKMFYKTPLAFQIIIFAITYLTFRIKFLFNRL